MSAGFFREGGLYAILDVDRGKEGAVEDDLAALLEPTGSGGPAAAVVQLRAKTFTTRERIALLERMGPLCAAAEVPLIVNDDLVAARAGVAGIAGLHLGQHDLAAHAAALSDGGLLQEGLCLGVSTHTHLEVQACARYHPTYLGFGPVFATVSKRLPEPVTGLAALEVAARQARVPVVAIGGFDAPRARQAIALGAAMVAFISALRGPDGRIDRDRVVTLALALAEAARPRTLDEVHAEIPVIPRDVLAELATWSDTLGTHLTLGLPARFRPLVREGEVLYRPSDVADLLYVLDKRRDETWEAWERRENSRDEGSALVTLRRSGSQHVTIDAELKQEIRR